MSDIQTPPAGTDEEPVTPTTTPETPTPPVVPPTVDYEKKFKESAREAQILAAQLEEERKRNSKPLTIDPTEQELRDLYPEWDSFLPSEKQFAKQTLLNNRTQATLASELAELKAEKAWEKDLKNALKAFPQLAGREAEFETFVFKPTHRGVSVDALAKAFLYDATKEVASTPPAPAPEGGLERGGSGRQERPKPKQLSATELRTLRQTDSKAYNEYVKTHDVDLDL